MKIKTFYAKTMAEALQEIKDSLTIIKRVEQGSKTAEVQQKRTPPNQVTGNAVQFGSHDPEVLGPWGDL